MKSSYKKILLFSLLILTTNFAFAQVRLPKLIADGMVLQRDTPLKIWGWASPNENITISFNGSEYKCSADVNGNWQTVIPEQKAGGAYTMTIKASNIITIKDILVGDVWLCSGQSNMALPMYRIMDKFEEEIMQINNPYIRQYSTPLYYNFQQPAKDLFDGMWRAAWMTAIPENIMMFSATAYFFAQNLYDKYHIPIGLINSSVGGSPIEAWISIETLKNYPVHVKEIEKCADEKYVENTIKLDRENTLNRTAELNRNDMGLSKWHQSDVDMSNWDEISLPGYWMDKDIDLKYGVIWFRKEIDVPESMVGKDGVIRLGCIVDGDSTFINGTYVGNITYQYPPRIYPFKAGILKPGKNVVAIRVVCDGKYGGFVEEKPYKITVGDENIDLTGQWKYKIGAKLSTPMKPTTTFYYKPLGLYNGMIAPLLNFSIKGVIWYQGESNTERADEYVNLLPDLIKDWRNKFNRPQLPFILAQLPNFMKAKKIPTESDWASIRNTQRKTLDIPNTGMAVTIDIGEWNDIHPLNKKELGLRLALEAQRVAYNESLVSSGPLYKSMEIKNNSIILTFTSTGTGIYTNIDLHGFAIAGEDGKYVWADAVVIAKDKVKVWNHSVKNPVSARYAWADNPDDANLKNKEGLPASPFQTEN
jgi:sialate O-acetylesterase